MVLNAVLKSVSQEKDQLKLDLHNNEKYTKHLAEQLDTAELVNQ